MDAAERGPGLEPLLADRFSPVGFDAQVNISPPQVSLLLEAARRAPSAGNSQPWRFIMGVRGDPVHHRIVGHLARSSAVWAGDASLLVVNLTQVQVEDAPELMYSEFSVYDVGQAVAHMTLQAVAMGYQAHQFRAFDLDGIVHEFAVPDHLQVMSMTAFGVPTHGPDISGPGTTRHRLASEQLLLDASRPAPAPTTSD